MPRVAIVAALEREVRPLVKTWRIHEREHCERVFRFYEEDGVVLVCGGIGAAAVRRAAEAVIVLYSPAVVYSVGFAGALEPGVKVGTVIQPAQVINASDGSRVSMAEGSRVLVSFGSVASPTQKAGLREAFGAHIVDMEAAAVARAAQARGVEFGVVKAVSDEFDFVFPSMDRFVDAEGQFQQGRFAWFAALRPWLWLKIFRLAVNSSQASSALCCWLAASLNRLRAQGEPDLPPVL